MTHMLNADPPAPAVEQASTADIAALTALMYETGNM